MIVEKKTVCSQSVISVCRKECFISFCERQECLFYISMNRKQMASSVYDTWPVKLLLLNLLCALYSSWHGRRVLPSLLVFRFVQN